MMFHDQKDEPRSMLRARNRRKARPRRNNLRLNINEFTLEPRTLLTISNFVLASPLNPVEGQLFKNFTGQNAASLIATFTDTNNPSPVQFNAFLSWGDGSFDQGPNAGGGVFILPDGAVPHQFDVYDTPSGGNPTGGHTYLEESINPLTLSLFVTDTIDNGFGFGSAAISVADAPLKGSSVGTITPTEGVSFTGPVATFVDTDPNAILGEWIATVDWGDGTVSAGTITQPGGAKTPLVVTGTHTYAEEGTYPSFDGKGNQIHGPVTVTITDTDGHVPTQGTRATTTVSDTAVVGDAPLSPTSPQIPFAAVEGNAASGIVATFLDQNPNAPTSDFSGTINWGDTTSSTFTSANVQFVSSSAAGAIFAVHGTHSYPEEGTKTLSTVINDIGGKSTTVSNTANIGDAPIAVDGTQIQAVEGSSKAWLVGTITDFNPGAPASDFNGPGNVVYWGDGTTSAFNSSNLTLVTTTPTTRVWTVSVSHAYAEDGLYGNNGITDPTKAGFTGITVKDVGGSTALATSGAFVADAPLHGVNNISIPAQTESAAFTPSPLKVGSFSDEDPGGIPADYTVSINWGDFSVPTPGTVVATGHADPAHPTWTTFDVYGTHALYSDGKDHGYAEEGKYTVTVQVTDTDGHLPATPGVPRAGTNSTSTLTVNDAPLSPAAFVPFSPSVGVPFIGKVATFHDTDLGTPGDPTDGTNVGDYSATIIFDTAHPATSTFPGFISYDGTTGNYSVSGSFTYPALGVYNVSVTIKDVGGATVTVGGQVLATLLPPTVTGVNIGAVEGTSFTAPVATFTNANGNYTGGYSATINWGDTTSSTGVITTGARECSSSRAPTRTPRPGSTRSRPRSPKPFLAAAPARAPAPPR